VFLMSVVLLVVVVLSVYWRGQSKPTPPATFIYFFMNSRIAIVNSR